MDSLKYPIGKFAKVEVGNHLDRSAFIANIEACPGHLRASVNGLDDSQLDTPYRDEGWTLRQVVHHMFDSHANAYIRFRLALTEDTPRITPYLEASWAELDDTFSIPVATGLNLLEGLHDRFVATIKAMSPEDFSRTLDHPEIGIVDLDFMLQMYSWHSLHHVAHIVALRKRMGW